MDYARVLPCPVIEDMGTDGVITGPRYFHGGACLSGTSGHADWDLANAPIGRKGMAEQLGLVTISNSPDEYREAVRWNLRNGATVKLFAGGGVASQFDPLESVTATAKEIQAVVEAAEGFGTYVCVHAFNDKSVKLALDNGVRCVEHGFLMEEDTVKRMAKEEAYADLILVNGNPTKDVTILLDHEKNIPLVMTNGVIHKNRL
jgi:imidazolonepropionase-like amidohydrolase